MSFMQITSKVDLNVPFHYGVLNLEKNISYILHESWIQLIPNADTILNIHNIDYLFKKFNFESAKTNLTNKKILFIRSLGGGDLLFLSAIAIFIKSQFNCQIDLACVNEQHELVHLLDGLDHAVTVPIKLHKFKEYDYHFEVSGLLENSNQTNLNAYDVYFNSAGIKINEVSDEFKRPAIKKNIITKNTQKDSLIGIHPFAHDPIRMINPNLIIDWIKKFQNKGFKISILGSLKEKEKYGMYFEKLNVKWQTGSYEFLINNILECSSVIATDSIVTHLCQGLNKHCISIYGPFSSESRVKYYQNIDIIDTFPNCRCSAHGVGHCPKGYIFSPCLNVDFEILYQLITNQYHSSIDNKIIDNISKNQSDYANSICYNKITEYNF